MKKTKKVQLLGDFPQSDWNQTDEESSEFIKNKPTLGALASKDKVAKGDLTAELQASLGTSSSLTGGVETDPTVPDWAKTPNKPEYTASEVEAVAYTAQILTEEQKKQARSNIGAGTSSFSGKYKDLIDTPIIPSTDELATTIYVDGQLDTKVDKVAGKGLSTNDFTDTYKNKVDAALQAYTESDPTVPLWAKASSKPTYTATEVGAISYDVAQILTEEQKAQARANIGTGTSTFSGDYNDLTNQPKIPSIEGLATTEYVDTELSYKVDKISGKGLSTNDFTNSYKKKVDSALQSYTETDPTVPLWAKTPNKPTYTANEVGAISYKVIQVLTEEQKAQARANIGAGTGGAVTPGADGYSPTAIVSKTGKTATITITDKTGTTTASINDGNDGVSCSHLWSGTTLIVTSASGTSSADLRGRDGTSVGITNISESTEYGGDNVVTFSDGKTLTIKNGTAGSGGGSGTSITITSISESTEDGGSNVVRFSDGKTLTVKNGSKGSTPVKGTDYYTEADKAEMVNLVLAALPSASGVSF